MTSTFYHLIGQLGVTPTELLLNVATVAHAANTRIVKQEAKKRGEEEIADHTVFSNFIHELRLPINSAFL